MDTGTKTSMYSSDMGCIININKTMNEEIIKKLKTLAEKRSVCDHLSDNEWFDPQDVSGGNFDDCFSVGTDEGQIQLSREILDMLGIDYTIPPKKK